MDNSSNYITLSRGKVRAKLDVFIYLNDGCFITYAPALDLCGYGENEEEAKASFEIVLHEYLKFAIENKTLNSDLIAHGWEKTKEMFKGSDSISLLMNNEQLQSVAKQDYKKTSREVTYAIN